MTQEAFDRMETECALKIKKNQFIDYELDEMVALKLYSDYTAECAILRKAHWKSKPFQMKRRWYHWAHSIYLAALRHAVPIQSDNQKVASWLYHGLSLLFRMDQELPTYFGPFSTTLSKHVANSFTKETGLRLHIQSGYSDSMTRCLGIDMRSNALHFVLSARARGAVGRSADSYSEHKGI